MKKVLAYLFPFFLISVIGAQTPVPLEVTTNIMPPYPMKFQTWISDTANYMITVQNHSDVALDYYLIFSLESVGGGEEAYVRLVDGFFPENRLSIEPMGFEMLSSSEISEAYSNLLLEDVETSANINLSAGGELPEGEYVLCFDVLIYLQDDDILLGPKSCSDPFTVSHGDIHLAYPINEMPVPEDQVIQFSWVTNTSAVADFDYSLRIFEFDELLQEEESIEEAFIELSVEPFFFEDGIMGTTFDYDPTQGAIEMTVGRMYAAQVTATNAFNSVYLENGGRSNIVYFWYGQNPNGDEFLEEEVTEVNPEDALTESQVECFERCQPNFPEDIAVVSSEGAINGLSQFKMGHFIIEDLAITSVLESGSFAGTGTVKWQFMNDLAIAVNFVNVQVNAVGEAVAGSVTAVDESASFGAPGMLGEIAAIMNGDGHTTETVLLESLDAALATGRLVGDIVAGTPIGVPFGFNQPLAGQQFLFACSRFEIAIDPTTSRFAAKSDFLAILNMPALGSAAHIGLGASNVCIAPDGFGNELVYNLAVDIPIPLDGDLTFYLKGGTYDAAGNDPSLAPTYLEMDCNGFRAINLAGRVEFPETVLRLEENDTIAEGLVNGYFNSKFEVLPGEENNVYAALGDVEGQIPGTHMMLSYTMDDFQLADLNGWGFSLTEGYLDLSEVENPPNIVFDGSYDWTEITAEESAGDMQNLWQGFYLKQVSLRPPKNMTTGERGEVAVENIMIDPAFSCDILTNQILPYEKGNIKGWGISVDLFELKIVQNNFLGGGIEGNMGTPIIGEGETLAYSADFHRRDEDGKYELQALIQPTEDIEIPLVVATATVCASSYIGFKIAPEKENTNLDVFLKGGMSCDLGEVAGQSLDIQFADYQLRYNSGIGFVTAQDVSGSEPYSSFGFGITEADQMCTDADFPTLSEMMGTLDDIKLTANSISMNRSTSANVNSSDSGGDSNSDGGGLLDGLGSQETLNGFPMKIHDFGFGLNAGNPVLSFALDLSLSGTGQGLNIGTDLSLITGSYLTPEEKKKFTLEEVVFECGRLSQDLDFMTFAGCLCYENDGDIQGYFGQVVVDVKDKLSVNLKAGFATYGAKADGVSFGTADYHGMWYIDGLVNMSPGIRMGPIELNGVGGGIYWNVQPPPLIPGPDELLNLEGEGLLPDTEACLRELNVPNIDQVLNQTSAALSSGIPTWEYGARTIKTQASMSIITEQILIADPIISVSWNANEGIEAIETGAWFYLLQENYTSRGAPLDAEPTSESTGLPDGSSGQPEGDLATGLTNIGSRVWGSQMMGLYIDRSSGSPQFALLGQGIVYLNLLPDLLYGDSDPTDKYKLVEHDIAIGAAEHSMIARPEVSSDTYFHFYLGNPYEGQPGKAKFDLMSAVGNEDSENAAALAATGYLMLGNGIPTHLPPAPPEILAILNGSSTSSGENSFEADDAVDTDHTAQARSATTTEGIILGGSVSAELGFHKIIYADLNVDLGFDMMLSNVSGSQCYLGAGQGTDEPGIYGWYGNGRVYAGLSGALGIRGKIFGFEVDYELFELGAAMMIEGGGPNPFWFDGRAAVYYSVLNGKINGSARVEISLGNKCYTYPESPFGVPVIAETYPPEPAGNLESFDPYLIPTTTFTMAVTELGQENKASITVPDVNDEEWTLAPIVSHFSITPAGNNQLSAPNSDREISDTRKSVRLHFDEALAEESHEDAKKKRWTFKVEIQARYIDENGNWTFVEDPDNPGQNWSESREFDFRTEALPLYNNLVTHTYPIKGHNFHFAGETPLLEQDGGHDGKFLFDSDVQDQYFYNELGDKSYTYHLLTREANSGEVIDDYQIPPYQRIGDEVSFSMPDLETNRTYIMQLVRRGEAATGAGFTELASFSKKYSGVAALKDFDLSNEYTVNAETDAIDPALSVGNQETLIHHLVFSTSKYQTLQDKLSGVTLSLEDKSHDDFQILHIEDLAEPFDEIDLLGLTTTVIRGASSETFVTQARVSFNDPLDGVFHDTYSKPLMNELFHSFTSDLEGQDVGLSMWTNIGEANLDDRDASGIGNNPTETEGFPVSGGGDSNDKVYEDHHLCWSGQNQRDQAGNCMAPFGFTYLDDNKWGLSNPYGNDYFLINDHVRPNLSVLPSPLSQEIGEGSEVSLMGRTFDVDVVYVYGGSELSFKYYTRSNIYQDAEEAADDAFQTIDQIENPVGPLFKQDWDEITVANKLSPFKDAFNALVESPLYTGALSTVSTSPAGFSYTGAALEMQSSSSSYNPDISTGNGSRNNATSGAASNTSVSSSSTTVVARDFDRSFTNFVTSDFISSKLKIGLNTAAINANTIKVPSTARIDLTITQER